jgi:hypothetical protein
MSVILQILPAQQSAAPDGTAQLAVHVVTSERLTGLDWSFAPGTAQLLSRDLAGSAFPDVVTSDLSGDLGASVQDVSQPVGPGDFVVATFKFRVAGTATTIETQQFPGTTGYVLGAPDFQEKPFDGFGSAVINFPEPSLMLAAGLVWAFLRRRRCRIN